MPLREREGGPAEAAGEAVRGVAGIGARDVEVEHRPEQEPVADGTPDDPGLLVAQDLAEALIHRPPPAGPGPTSC